MFQCEKCGQCCRHLDRSDIYKELNRGDGICIYLKDNLCSIYETRPILCRVDESYEYYFKELYSKQEYYELNYRACKKIKEE